MEYYLKIIIAILVLDVLFETMAPSGKIRGFARSMLSIIIVLIIITTIIKTLKEYLLI
ncbi:MAG: hypothetical protein IJT25_01730 [Clostridia bacterium]|nr:hypothetical protein [Clostridia bacterium]